jgi:hypothetical protein
MASQDNPEQGLCHHATAPRPIPEVTKPSKPKTAPIELRTAPARPQDLRSRRRSIETKQTLEEDRDSSKDSSRNDKQARRKTSMGDVISRRAWPDLTALEEPTPLDHRSFVQNVFGTVAFKMLEWLTPRNLDILARSGDKKAAVEEESLVEVGLKEDPIAVEALVEIDKHATVTKPGLVEEAANDDSKKKENPVEAGNDSSKAQETPVEHSQVEKVHQVPSAENSSKVPSILPTPTRPKSDAEEKPIPKLVNQDSLTKRPSSLRKKTDHHDPASKGIVNKMTSDPIAEVKPTLPSHVPSMPRRKMSRQTVITSPKMQMTDAAPALHELKFLPPTRSITGCSRSTQKAPKDSQEGTISQNST